MNRNFWDNLEPHKRIAIYEAAIKNCKPGNTLTEEDAFVLIHQCDTDTIYCENCDEKFSEIEMYSYCDEDDLQHLPDLAQLMHDKGITWCCMWCAEELTGDKETKLLKVRKNLLEQMDKFIGMPTLDYDPIIQSLENQIIEVERQLLKTCEDSGGEIIPDGIDLLILVPENGLCAGELPECEVKQ